MGAMTLACTIIALAIALVASTSAQASYTECTVLKNVPLAPRPDGPTDPYQPVAKGDKVAFRNDSHQGWWFVLHSKANNYGWGPAKRPDQLPSAGRDAMTIAPPMIGWDAMRVLVGIVALCQLASPALVEALPHPEGHRAVLGELPRVGRLLRAEVRSPQAIPKVAGQQCPSGRRSGASTCERMR
jgi:hypothetical protein